MDEVRYRAERRIKCDAYQASLHCTPDERQQLDLALDAWKAGSLSTDDILAVLTFVRRLNVSRQAA